MKNRYFVINADDFGYSRERSIGLVECFQKHAITYSSFLVNMTGFYNYFFQLDFNFQFHFLKKRIFVECKTCFRKQFQTWITFEFN